MTALPLLAYLAAVVWAVSSSSSRWMTLLWIVIGLGATLGVFFVLSLIMPYGAGVLGHTALIPMLLFSALAGIYHMRSHQRPPRAEP